MIRVAVVTRSITFGDGVGGMERAASDHIKAVAALGIEVTLIATRTDLTGAPDNVKVVAVPWPGTGKLSRALFGIEYTIWTRRVRSVLAKTRFDVVHFHGASVGAVDRNLADRAITNPHGMEEFGKSGAFRYISRAPTRRLSRRAARCARIISTDASITPVIIENLGVPRERVVLIPNAIDVDRLQSLATGAVRRDNFVILSLGRVVPNKGHDLLLAALRDDRLAAALPHGWQWHHFGSGPDLERLRSAAALRPVVPLVIHECASDAEVQREISVADIFIQPSRYEGSSLTVLEAMAHGAAVVATPVGGIPDKISDGSTGYLSASASPQSIADSLLRALTAKTPTGPAARARVEREFSWASAANDYVELYRKLTDP